MVVFSIQVIYKNFKISLESVWWESHFPGDSKLNCFKTIAPSAKLSANLFVLSPITRGLKLKMNIINSEKCSKVIFLLLLLSINGYPILYYIFWSFYGSFPHADISWELLDIFSRGHWYWVVLGCIQLDCIELCWIVQNALGCESSFGLHERCNCIWIFFHAFFL